MQQQLMATVKGDQSAPKKPAMGSNRGQRRNSQSTSTSSQSSQLQGNSQNSDTARNNQTQTRRGNDQNQIQCYNCQGWGHMCQEFPRDQNSRLLNFQRGRQQDLPPNIWAKHRACISAGTKPQPTDVIPNPLPPSDALLVTTKSIMIPPLVA